MILHAENICKKIKNRDILDGINLHLEQGEMLAVLGPKGSGKTTLMRIILGLIAPDDGEMILFDEKLTNVNAATLREDIGFQNNGNLYEELTIMENLKLWLDFYQVDQDLVEERIDMLLDFFDVRQFKDYQINQLSKDDRQKALLIRALCLSPKLLIFDEPTMGLDPESREVLGEYLNKMKELGVTIIICSHLLCGLEEYADQVLIINKGRPVLYGHTSALIRQYFPENHVVLTVDGRRKGHLSKISHFKYSFDIENRDIIIDLEIKDYEELNKILQKLIEWHFLIKSVESKKYTIRDLYFSQINIGSDNE